MIGIRLKFPVGVYYAQSAQDPGQPEWPPSPVRLVGALLAAAHDRSTEHDSADDRALVQRLCQSDPPHIVAPRAAAVEAPAEGDAAFLRGPSRWAPRNYFGTKGRSQAAVEKVGVAIGDRPVWFIWPNLSLEPLERDRLEALLADITFLGTSRSPVIAVAATEMPDDDPAWVPLDGSEQGVESVAVRVPDERTVATFDARHELFRSTNGKVQRATMVPSPPIGYQAPYAFSEDLEAISAALDPGWWDDMIVIPIDAERSELIPKAAGSYLLARATRLALLGAYADAGRTGEAPPILRDRGGDPHCAIVPLANVLGTHSDGRVMGIAVLLPSEQRVPDLADQRRQVEEGLAQFLRDAPDRPQRFVQIPGAGKVWLRAPSAEDRPRWTLNPAAYRRPARSWASVTPVVHSRWQKPSEGGVLGQISRDCAHVGLPGPESVEVLRGRGRHGGAANRPALGAAAPTQWRNQLAGPIDHVRVTFPVPVLGPIVLGKARHFGLGLCVPDDRSDGGEQGTPA